MIVYYNMYKNNTKGGGCIVENHRNIAFYYAVYFTYSKM